MHSALRTLPILALAVLAAFPDSARADEPALPAWGEFTREELFARHFPEAPDADAVVLSDHGRYRVDESLALRTFRHRRVKIFTQSGAERHGTVRIPYGPEDKILDFRAQTVVPPERQVKAQRRDETTPDGNRVCVVTFADVAPGTIVEYSCEQWSPQISRLAPWTFQGDDPTRLSRIDLQLPAGMAYLSSFSWTPGAAPKPETRVVLDPERMERELQQSTWIERDVPAFRPEPQLVGPEDYRRRIHLQLTTFASGGAQAGIAPDWDEVAAGIAGTWAEARAQDGGVAAWLAGASGDTPSATARALHRRIRDGITESGAGDPKAPAPLRETVAAARGTVADKNLLLLHALEDAGIPARGILVRPRPEGRLVAAWRAPEQLSAMIVEATLDGSPVRLDAAAGCPFGVLVPDLDVREGVVVAAAGGGVRPLGDGPARSVVAGTRARLGAGGDLVARTRWTLTGPEAAAAGTAAAAQTLDRFLRGMLPESFAAADVSDATATEGDDGTVTVDASLRVPGWGAAAGEDFRFRIPFLFAEEANPVPAGGRIHPLEFAGPTTRDETLELRLPTGYRLVRAPAGARAAAAGMTFVTAPETADDILKVRRRLEIRETSLPMESHATVREFYDTVLAEDDRELSAEPAPSLADGTR